VPFRGLIFHLAATFRRPRKGEGGTLPDHRLIACQHHSFERLHSKRVDAIGDHEAHVLL
jgi:hypothetical protein